MKKGIALLLATLMCLSLTACGGTGEQSSGQDSSGEDTAAPDYPTTNISCIIPYGAGGTMDQLSRALFQSLSEDALPSNVNFVVENVAGGGGLVGTEQGLTRAADGYTIVGVNGDLIINRAIGATDIVLQEDFTPIVCPANFVKKFTILCSKIGTKFERDVPKLKLVKQGKLWYSHFC